MRVMKSLLGGVVAGLIGAAIWAGISYGTGYEIGWIAWGIGVLVGFGVAWSSRGGMPAGVLAVVISILAILGGKYAAVQLVLNKELADPSQLLEQMLANLKNEELVVSFLADDIVAEREAHGETIAWPRGVVPEEAEKQSDYPSEIWSEASSRWNEMAEEDREAYRAEIGDSYGEYVDENFEMLRSEISKEGLFNSVAVLDMVFFLLAVVTAFKIAARGEVVWATGLSGTSTVPCPKCGRQNAPTTRVCPRCETRLVDQSE